MFSSILLIIFITNSINGQENRTIFIDLVKEEQEAVNAIVLYPEETRMAILNASSYPEALIKIESIQSNTRASFLDLVEKYPQNVQEEIWDLTRYPNLINTLVITPEPDIDNALEAYPEIIHQRAKKIFSTNYDLLNLVDELNFIAESKCNYLLNEYPEDVQNSINHLINQPEVLTILMDNIKLTILAGNVYKNDPKWLLQKIDSLHLQLAIENAKELEDWKQSLEDDPESAELLKEVSEKYTEEYKYYDDEYYEYDSKDRNITVNNYYDYNYPYWFGYPTWYTYPRWRVHPYWYDWGFYYGPNNRIIVLGLPSFNFTYWYFGMPSHHYNYSPLSTHFANHYYGHRNSTGSVTTSVSRWRTNNRDIVSDKWIKDDGKLKNRFQEFGIAEVKRNEYNRNNPGREITQSEFISKNKAKYPTLTQSIKQVQTDRKNVLNETKATNPKTNSVRSTNRATKKEKQPARSSKTTSVNPNTSKSGELEQKTRSITNRRKAEDFHKSSWENTSTKRTKSQQPKTQIKKSKVTKTKVPQKSNPKSKKSKGN